MTKKIKGTLIVLFLVLTAIFFFLVYLAPFLLLALSLGLGITALATFIWKIKGSFLGLTLTVIASLFCYPALYLFSWIGIAFTFLAYSITIIAVIKLREFALKLEISEDQYRKVVEQANDGIVIIKDNIIKYANPRINKILGHSPEKITGRDFSEYIDKRNLKKVMNYCRKGEDIPSVCEAILKHKKGGAVFVELNASDINYKGEDASLIIIRDITRRKQVEEILYQREQEFKILVENAPDIIARFDKELRCLYINPKTEKEFGISPKYFFWKTLSEAGFSKRVAEIWEESLKYVFEKEEEKVLYAEQNTPSGTRYYQIRMAPEYDKNKKIRTVLLIARDITRAKDIDKIKSDFISISSHQLRTPLSIVRWCSNILLEESSGDLTEEQRDYINKIYSASKKMIRLTNAFLNVAILDLGVLNVSPRLVDVSKVADEIIQDFKIDIKEKAINLEKKYEKKIPKIKADERLLKIVLRGLISNAIRYTDFKGNVSVEIKTEPSNILVRIADDGCGIADKDKRRIFSKFFRADNVKDRESQGAGLDLYIIKSIIDNSDGQIWFKSPNPDIKGKSDKRGTVFYFTLPKRGLIKKKNKGGITVS